jgi:hypothetical protein
MRRLRNFADVVIFVASRFSEVQIRFFRGDLVGAEEHFIQMGSLLDASGFAHYVGQFVPVMGVDAKVLGAQFC